MFGLGVGLNDVAIWQGGPKGFFANGQNLFFGQASYDAYSAGAKTLVSTAILQTLGITNAVATTNPPGTVTLKDGTVGYGAHNLLTNQPGCGLNMIAGATSTDDGTIGPDGLAARLVNRGAGGRMFNDTTASGNRSYGYSVWLKAGSVSTATIYVKDTSTDVARGTTVCALTSTWQRFFVTGVTAGGTSGYRIELECAISQSVYAAGGQITLGSAMLDYWPAGYAPRLTYDRGATTNMLLNSATLSTQTVTVVSGQTYTISALGTGTVTLSSGGAGTLTCNAVLRNQVTFVASGTSVVCTVSGSVLRANFNPGYATNYLATTGAILTTNGTPRSQNLHTASADVTSWARNGTTLTGTQTVYETATGGDFHNIQSNVVPVTAGCVYTFRARVKPIGRTNGLIRSAQAPMGDCGVKIDFAAVTVAVLNSAFGQTITGPDASGYYTITWRAAAASSGTTGFYYASCDSVPANANGTTHTGDITKGVIIDSVWCYEGTADLPYYPTTGAAYSEYPQAGLLREVARTNSIRNNTMVGAAAGSPGTLPTNWAASGGGLTGLTRTIAVGTENGAPYIDLRYNGTSAGGSIILQFDSTAVAASAAQDWTGSVCARLAAGTLTGLSAWALNSDWGSPGYISTTGVNQTAPGAIDARMVAKLTAPATTTVGGPVYLQFTAGAVAVDFTLRIKLPQWELGAFATSPIPTTSATVTRSEDVDSDPISLPAAGTIMAEFSILPGSQSGTRRVLSTIGTAGPEINMVGTGVAGAISNVVGGIGSTVIADGSTNKIAFRYQAGNHGTSVNGASVGTNSNATAIGTINVLNIAGSPGGTESLCGGIRRIAITSTVATDTQLQQISSGIL